jgi:hypothetical protein
MISTIRIVDPDQTIPVKRYRALASFTIGSLTTCVTAYVHRMMAVYMHSGLGCLKGGQH